MTKLPLNENENPHSCRLQYSSTPEFITLFILCLFTQQLLWLCFSSEKVSTSTYLLDCAPADTRVDIVWIMKSLLVGGPCRQLASEPFRMNMSVRRYACPKPCSVNAPAEPSLHFVGLFAPQRIQIVELETFLLMVIWYSSCRHQRSSTIDNIVHHILHYYYCTVLLLVWSINGPWMLLAHIGTMFSELMDSRLIKKLFAVLQLC